MNTIIQKSDPSSYSDSKILELVEREGQKGLTMAESTGKMNALSFFPPLTGIPFKLVCEFLTNHFNTLLSEVNNHINGPLQIQLGAMERNNISEKQTNVQRQIIQAESILSGLTRKDSDKQVFGIFLFFILTLTLLFFVIVGEWMYMAYSLQIVTSSFQTSLLLGLTITLCIAVPSHYGELWIQKAIKLHLTRKIIRVCFFVFLGVLFFGLGLLRQNYLHKIGVTTNDNPIWIFVVLNVFLYISLFLISEMMLTPVISEIKEAFRILKNRNKIRKTNNQITALKEQLTSNQDGLYTSLTDKLKITSFHRNMEVLVNRYYQQSISKYKQVNMETRPDGIPDCFTEDAPELEFFTSNINL